MSHEVNLRIEDENVWAQFQPVEVWASDLEKALKQVPPQHHLLSITPEGQKVFLPGDEMHEQSCVDYVDVLMRPTAHLYHVPAELVPEPAPAT